MAIHDCSSRYGKGDVLRPRVQEKDRQTTDYREQATEGPKKQIVSLVVVVVVVVVVVGV